MFSTANDSLHHIYVKEKVVFYFHFYLAILLFISSINCMGNHFKNVIIIDCLSPYTKKEKQCPTHHPSIITHLKRKRDSPSSPYLKCHMHKKYKDKLIILLHVHFPKSFSKKTQQKTIIALTAQYARLCTHLYTLQCHYYAHGYSSNSFITCKMLYFSITTSLPCIFSVRKLYIFTALG